jgi:hypothetical protein
VTVLETRALLGCRSDDIIDSPSFVISRNASVILSTETNKMRFASYRSQISKTQSWPQVSTIWNSSEQGVSLNS